MLVVRQRIHHNNSASLLEAAQEVLSSACLSIPHDQQGQLDMVSHLMLDLSLVRVCVGCWVLDVCIAAPRAPRCSPHPWCLFGDMAQQVGWAGGVPSSAEMIASSKPSETTSMKPCCVRAYMYAYGDDATIVLSLVRECSVYAMLRVRLYICIWV